MLYSASRNGLSIFSTRFNLSYYLWKHIQPIQWAHKRQYA